MSAFSLPAFHASLSDSVLRLTSLSRICTALYGHVDSSALSRQSGSLSRVLFRKAGAESLPLPERLSLLSSLYDLQNGTSFLADREAEERWNALAEELIAAAFACGAQAGDEPLCIPLCRCLSDYFYFDPSPEEDVWFRFLRNTVARFGESISKSSEWPGLSLPEALGRLEVMDRYSYMFLDHTYDGIIGRAFRRYSSLALSVREGIPLAVWGQLYDLSRSGNACPSDASLSALSLSEMERLSGSGAEGEDAALYVLSCRISGLCREEPVYV